MQGVVSRVISLEVRRSTAPASPPVIARDSFAAVNGRKHCPAAYGYLSVCPSHSVRVEGNASCCALLVNLDCRDYARPEQALVSPGALCGETLWSLPLPHRLAVQLACSQTFVWRSRLAHFFTHPRPMRALCSGMLGYYGV